MALVIFLKGINVGGHRTTRPSILAGQLKEFGVLNIGAAGTLVVCKRASKSLLRSELLRRLPFEAKVMMCTGHELIEAASVNPFQAVRPRSDIVRFVSVLEKPPKFLPSFPIRIPESGKWFVRILAKRGRFVFGIYRREMKVIRYLNAIDDLFGVPATIRNWNTIGAIIKVLNESGSSRS